MKRCTFATMRLCLRLEITLQDTAPFTIRRGPISLWATIHPLKSISIQNGFWRQRLSEVKLKKRKQDKIESKGQASPSFYGASSARPLDCALCARKKTHVRMTKSLRG